MKKIVPFKKDINFKTNIAEITSISLEHTLKVGNFTVDGDFTISGEYKMADVSTNTESFSFDLPCSISIDDKYLLDKVEVDIDDFYYEIINDKTLVVNIDVALNNLEEKPLIEDRADLPEALENPIIIEEPVKEVSKEIVKEDTKKVEVETKEKTIIKNVVNDTSDRQNINVFNSFTEKESIATYRVYIVREGDIVDGIIEKYGITKELLEKYNNITDIKIGDKLIIPTE